MSAASPDLRKVGDGEANPREKPTVSLEDSSNFLSRLFLGFLGPLFRKGANSTLEQEDLGAVAVQDRCETLWNKYRVLWEAEAQLPREKRSLWRVLWRTVGYYKLALSMTLYGMYAALQFGPVLILNALVRHFEGISKLSDGVLWTLVALMFVLPMMGSVCTAQSNVLLVHIGVQFRNILINAIYRKALVLSPSARQTSSTGQIMNMFSNDTLQLQRFLFFLNFMVLALPQIVVAITLIYFEVGVATFVGLGFIFILMPFNGLIFGFLNKFRQDKVKVSDRRVKLMNEILSGIRVIKFYAWESAFMKKVGAIRHEELILLRKIAYVISIGFTVLLMSVPLLMPVVIFYFYIEVLGNQLDAAKAFTTIALFNIMQFPFAFLPLGLAQYSQSKVGIERMLNFFAQEELEPYVKKDEGPDGVVVSMKDVSMSWVTQDALDKAAAAEAKAAAAAAKKNKGEGKGEGKNVASGKEYTKISGKGTEVDAEEGKDRESSGAGLELTEVRVKAEAVGGAYAAAETADVSPEDTKDGTGAGLAGINRSVHTLEGLNFQVKKGQLVAIVGPVGCGKSSVIAGLLGELTLNSGEVRVAGSVAFCDQRSWILNDTVKENILFGMPYDEERFDIALYAANLESDVQILPGGIQTQIGERGINLSGGQKARVALARAIYRDSDIYLLDDPLSAVDAHVGEFLFSECIRGTLAQKTRIVVMHQVHLLPQCDLVIIMDEAGFLKAVGSYDELIESGVDISQYVPEQQQQQQSRGDTDNSPGKLPNASSVTSIASASSTGDNKQKSESSKKESQLRRDASKVAAKLRKQDTRSTMITSKEEKQEGFVKLGAYWYYIVSGGTLLFSLVIFAVLGSQAFQLLASFYLAQWGEDSVDRRDEGREFSNRANLVRVSTYAVINVLSLVCQIGRAFFLSNHRLGTSLVLHEGLLKGTMKAPIAFFDVTPAGRVLNRFSADLVTIDEELSQTLSQLSNTLGSVLGAMGAIAAATFGTALVPMVPLIVFYNKIQTYYRKSNTAIARLERTSLSPVFVDFNQVLNGVNSIRAYGDQQRFVSRLEHSVDTNSIANVMQQFAGNWLTLRLDVIGSSLALFIAALAAATPGDFISGGLVGLALSYAIQLTSYLKFSVRMIAQLEANMSAVERVWEYTSDLAPEGLPERMLEPENLPDDSWPTKGAVVAENIDMRYRDGPLVLKNVSFSINAMEKVGVAGRTGSGKSSLMIALFRIQELADGALYIDGVDISTLPLELLRSKLGIIPQDPVMFSASVRFNLDPFDQHGDKEVWEVLESVNLKDHILSLPAKLSEDVAEGGDNFSAGQRQLICIARAILRKPKILVLDEATASIDNETDAMIQAMIRREFKDCTVLTIAHRLHTIIDSDRIMTLQDGELAEFGSPEQLLQTERGLFRGLWERHQRHGGGSIARSASANSDLGSAGLDVDARGGRGDENKE